MQVVARGCRGLQGGALRCKRCMGVQGGYSEVKPAAAKPAAAKADYSRLRQTMVHQSILISAVLPASSMHFFHKTINDEICIVCHNYNGMK